MSIQSTPKSPSFVVRPIDVAGERIVVAPARTERVFWIGLVTAAVLHAMLFVSLAREKPPRWIGDAKGSAEGIEVEMVDAAQLFGSSVPALANEQASASPPAPASAPAPAPPPRETVPEVPPPPLTPETPPELRRVAPDDAPTPPAPPAQAEAAPRTEPQKPPAPLKVEDVAAIETASPRPIEPPREAVPPAARAEPRKSTAAETIEQQRPDLLTVAPPESRSKPADRPRSRQSEPKPTEQRQPQQEQQRQRQASLDAAVPSPDAQRIFRGNGGAAVSRPPGITRSGENDEFARRVIAALRQTMPQLNVRGRVTVRLVISTLGNLQEVQVIENAGDGSLVPNVVFSTKQASFPIPPARASEIDRIFLIRYIYN